jgi:hypothetical protein
LAFALAPHFSVCAVLALLVAVLSRPSFTYNINEMQRCLLFMKKSQVFENKLQTLLFEKGLTSLIDKIIYDVDVTIYVSFGHSCVRYVEI